ncbi:MULTISPECIES: DUF192 domain-containing protein [Pyrobaculum]|uniref:DUF192 domain-containing protein n=3 Tax=Pyrobaculum TaxID=2276 RepID=A4WKH5_PYRAR|nr:DUF192 domain-containing protein [Pyrobaculum arsenaticum]ABP50892.1 protein of unknown function DUF192 [Pyrobaculum arsenaticum DSM 13514]AFA38912.1 hypothetical protein Pogu_0885 [Pyrobaculum oguniense TE7]MCY0891319.1 DUF192 domain-containing protein [Pyrobaculum arsenaticum]NYR15388.1 DUF192 domain-containing protein [Pyrobaculum arsenaticum]
MAILLVLYAVLVNISPFSATYSVQIDGSTTTVYVADNLAKWAIGYMNVSSYDPRNVGAVGMLFVFPQNSTYCFWMKNTRIPLKIIWVSGQRVTYWAYGRPMDTRSVCGYGDKVLELDPRFEVPKVVKVGEQRPLHGSVGFIFVTGN